MPRFVIFATTASFGVPVHLEGLPGTSPAACYQLQRYLQLGGQGWGSQNNCRSVCQEPACAVVGGGAAGYLPQLLFEMAAGHRLPAMIQPSHS